MSVNKKKLSTNEIIRMLNKKKLKDSNENNIQDETKNITTKELNNNKKIESKPIIKSRGQRRASSEIYDESDDYESGYNSTKVKDKERVKEPFAANANLWPDFNWEKCDLNIKVRYKSSVGDIDESVHRGTNKNINPCKKLSNNF